MVITHANLHVSPSENFGQAPLLEVSQLKGRSRSLVEDLDGLAPLFKLGEFGLGGAEDLIRHAPATSPGLSPASWPNTLEFSLPGDELGRDD